MHKQKHCTLQRWEGSTDTQTNMLPGISWERSVRSKVWWFTRFCNLFYVSHFAVFFIVVGAKTSVAESCILIVYPESFKCLLQPFYPLFEFRSLDQDWWLCGGDALLSLLAQVQRRVYFPCVCWVSVGGIQSSLPAPAHYQRPEQTTKNCTTTHTRTASRKENDLGSVW